MAFARHESDTRAAQAVTRPAKLDKVGRAVLCTVSVYIAL
jgi:hypothetical protein